MNIAFADINYRRFCIFELFLHKNVFASVERNMNFRKLFDIRN